MQTKEYKVPGGFLVKVMWCNLELYFASEQVLFKTSKVNSALFVPSPVLGIGLLFFRALSGRKQTKTLLEEKFNLHLQSKEHLKVTFGPEIVLQQVSIESKI